MLAVGYCARWFATWLGHDYSLGSILTMMFQQPSNEAPSLDDYIKAITSRKWVVLLMTIFGLLSALLYQSYRTETFEAAARVVVGPSRRLSLNPKLAKAPNLEREREIMLGDDVFEQVARDLGIEVSEVHERVRLASVRFIPDSDVMALSASANEPADAAELVNTIAAAYVDQTEAAEEQFFNVRIKGLEEDIVEANDALAALDAEIADLLVQRAAAAALPANDTSGPTLISSIDAERATRQTSRQQLLIAIRSSDTQLRAIEAELGTRPSTALLFSPARVPTVPKGLSKSMLSAIGIILGASLGIAGAFLLARLDRRARGQDDIELALGQRVLASVPNFGVGFGDRRGQGALIMANEAKGPRMINAAEAFRRLRTGVSFLSKSDDSKVFLVSSAFPGEGKSTISANLAYAFAQSGQQTVLVSADLRRPSLERLFGIEATTGLSEWLGGDDNSDLLIELPEANLYFIPAGQRASNSSELLGSDRFALLIEELRSKFDVVLIDAPPVLATADAGAASKHVDGVIIVVDSRKTETDQLLQVRSDLDRAGSRLIGAVLNRERQKRTLPWRKRDRYSYAYV